MLDIITYTLYTIYKVRDRRSREKGENKMLNNVERKMENLVLKNEKNNKNTNLYDFVVIDNKDANYKTLSNASFTTKNGLLYVVYTEYSRDIIETIEDYEELLYEILNVYDVEFYEIYDED